MTSQRLVHALVHPVVLPLGDPALTEGVGVRLPLNSRVVNFGDSLTDSGDDTDADWGAGFAAWGYTTWANILGGARLYEPPSANLGVSGNTTTQMLARVANMNALNPKLVRVLGGTNDVFAGVSSATIIANLAAIYAHCRSRGAFINALHIPNAYAPTAYSAPQQVVRAAVNAWITSQSAYDLAVTDTSSLVSGDMDPSDGIHPLTPGSYKLGALAAAAEARLITTDSFADSFFAGTLLSANPTLSGTGGTNAGGVTGSIATGWNMGADTSTTTFVLSKNGSDQQVATLGGTSSLYALYVTKNGAPPSPVGKKYEALAEIVLPASFTGVASFAVLMGARSAGDAELASVICPSPQDNTVPTPMIGGQTYIVRSPTITAPANTVNINVTVGILPRSGGVAMSGAPIIKRAAFREVPAGA